MVTVGQDADPPSIDKLRLDAPWRVRPPVDEGRVQLLPDAQYACVEKDRNSGLASAREGSRFLLAGPSAHDSSIAVTSRAHRVLAKEAYRLGLSVPLFHPSSASGTIECAWKGFSCGSALDHAWAFGVTSTSAAAAAASSSCSFSAS